MYSNIVVDVFNLYHRVKGTPTKEDNAITLANKVIDTIKDLDTYQDKTESMYLLFDPIPKKDFGVDSAFKYSTRRQKVLPDYKINRKFSYCQGDLDAIEWIRKYFSHKGKHFIEVTSNCYEADDFVESLLEELLKNSKANIALVTTDNDWARYLNRKVVMLNKGFKEPYTNEDFIAQYNFTPTILSVTLFKALYGDPSDNIIGSLTQKRLKKLNLLKKEGFKWIQDLSAQSDIEDIDKIIERISHYTLEKVKSAKLESEKNFFFSVIASDFIKDFLDLTLTNIKVIRSQCKDYHKYAEYKDEDAKFNDFICEVLKRKQPKKAGFKLGKIRV